MRCPNCDNDINMGCHCPKRPVTRLEVLETMIGMGGGFVSALAVAWMKADQDNDRRLREAFPHYWDQYTQAAQLQRARRQK